MQTFSLSLKNNNSKEKKKERNLHIFLDTLKYTNKLNIEKRKKF